MSTSTPERKADSARPPAPRISKKTGKPETPAEHRVQVAAAKLRVTLDTRLNRPTPPDVTKLARESY